MKILLLGKNGQVGWELQRSLSVLGELVALDRHSEPCGDLGQPERLRETVRQRVEAGGEVAEVLGADLQELRQLAAQATEQRAMAAVAALASA